MDFDDFLRLLIEWGKWSRGGIPGYHSGSASPRINDDVAQSIDRSLCNVRKHMGKSRTESFELYYKSAWSLSTISQRMHKDSRLVRGDILAIESVLYMDFIIMRSTRIIKDH